MSLNQGEMPLIMVQTNKVSSPGWMTLNPRKLEWQGEQVQYVFQKKNLMNLPLGLRQGERSAKHEFAIALESTLLSDQKRLSLRLSPQQLKVIQEITFQVVGKCVGASAEIADIYYRQLRSVTGSVAEIFEISLLVKLANSKWWACKEDLRGKLRDHRDPQIRKFRHLL